MTPVVLPNTGECSMRTGRPKAALGVTDSERQQLISLTHRARTAPYLARRARIVLACAEGLDNKVVAKRLRVAPGTVTKWRARFVAERVEGLYDEPRPGTPRTITDAQIEDVIVRTLETTPRARRIGHARDGESRRSEPHGDSPRLARLRLAAASDGHLQAVARPALD
jgi:hypothetical protein